MPAFANVPQIWAHRGRHDKFSENSLPAFQHALESGAKGIEVDVHYDMTLNRFVVSHDLPAQPTDDTALFLETVFSSFGESFYYWIDFKNLNHLTQLASLNRIQELLTLHNLQAVVFIESPRGDLLSEFSNNGIQSIYWFTTYPEENKIKHLWELFQFYKIVEKSNFVAISADYSLVESYDYNIFGNFPLFLFTINDPERFDKCRINFNPHVILTDNPDLY